MAKWVLDQQKVHGNLAVNDADDGLKTSQDVPGAFGTVHRMVDTSTGQAVLLQTIQPPMGWKMNDIKRDLEVLHNLDHPHILPWHFPKGTPQSPEQVLLIMSDCVGGDLRSFLTRARWNHQQIREDWVATAFHQAFDALAYLHGKGVVHKHLKMQNLFLAGRGVGERALATLPHVKISNLGLTECFGFTGTPCQRAPEVWHGDAGPKCDIWCMGVIMFEVFTGSLPFVVEHKKFAFLDEERQAYLTCMRRGPDWMLMRHASKAASEFNQQLLAYYKCDRPQAIDCLADAWIMKLCTSSAKNSVFTDADLEYGQSRTEILGRYSIPEDDSKNEI
jgi:serine/threonine protein kinase